MSDIFNNLFGRKKNKHHSKRSNSPSPTDDLQPVNDCYTNSGETKNESDYEQLYSPNGNGWTSVGPNGEQIISNSNLQNPGTTPIIPFLNGVPFKATALSGATEGLQDVDLLLLQFSSKLSDMQNLVSADYDFNLENQLMDEAIQAAAAPTSPPVLEETEEEQMAKLMQFAQM